MTAAEQIRAIAAKALATAPETAAKTFDFAQASEYVGQLTVCAFAAKTAGDTKRAGELLDLAAKAAGDMRQLFVEKAQTTGVFNVVDLGDTTATQTSTEQGTLGAKGAVVAGAAGDGSKVVEAPLRTLADDEGDFSRRWAIQQAKRGAL